MTKDEALRLALEALDTVSNLETSMNTQQKQLQAITVIKAALLSQSDGEAKDEPVQVSPLQFVEMVMEKEDCVGKPIIWAEWPNKEKT
jgi:hypothetical protein